jgi:hypothetical protein
MDQVSVQLLLMAVISLVVCGLFMVMRVVHRFSRVESWKGLTGRGFVVSSLLAWHAILPVLPPNDVVRWTCILWWFDTWLAIWRLRLIKPSA